MSTIADLINRYSAKLDSALELRPIEDENYGFRWAILNHRGEEILLAESEYELIESLLGALDQDLPDVVDFIGRNY